jgi:hypothetical protein
MNRGRMVRWGVAGLAVVGLGAYAVVGEWIPGPQPTRPNGSWEVVDDNWNATEPEWGTELLVGGIHRDSASFSVYLGHNNWEHVSVRVGDTATLAGMTITLCDTWVNRWAYLEWPWHYETGGSATNGSRAYYVRSMDGTTPTCP